MLNVIIDETPYPRFPIVPREGLRLRIGGQVRVINEIEIDPVSASIVCKTVSPEEESKNDRGKPASETVSRNTGKNGK